jgi:hypothetical protein
MNPCKVVRNFEIPAKAARKREVSSLWHIATKYLVVPKVCHGVGINRKA